MLGFPTEPGCSSHVAESMKVDPAASVDPTVGDADPFYDPARRPIVTFAQMGQSIAGFVALPSIAGVARVPG